MSNILSLIFNSFTLPHGNVEKTRESINLEIGVFKIVVHVVITPWAKRIDNQF